MRGFCGVGRDAPGARNDCGRRSCEQQAERIYVREDRLRQRCNGSDVSEMCRAVERRLGGRGVGATSKPRLWRAADVRFGLRFGAATGGCDVRREVRVTALCGKQVYCWRQVTLLRTDADTRWADARRPATGCCGARASWHAQHAAATHMLQALRRRGAVIARIRYMVVRLAAVRDLRAPNVPEEPGYCLRSTDQAAPQFRGGDLQRDSGAKAHNFREKGWTRHASNPKVVWCVVSPCHGPPEPTRGRIYHIEHVTVLLLLTPVKISAEHRQG